ncbi:proteasome adapter and scaffold protein ECM29-like [Gigantopelta aegis]|uniref:proteasome adapter and scaffold protein ECM29-like n=1 Tax=Gigantopelta aegis TaxID=1735272 RepID=UPI001B88BBD7|nr:proteasome adapter and scaffold protein ECM29-like [Gigantopelta aegis]
MAGSASSQDERILVERVFLRIGSAETDEQLEKALGKFLTPVLIKLNSQEDGIRKKVMELLVHVNKRLKSRPKVQLPVEALMTQYQDPQATPFLTNFTILYIKMGYPRLSPEKQAELLPILVNCLDGRPLQHQDSILQLLIPALQHLKMPQNVEERSAKFGFGDKPKISKLLLDYMLDVLLLTYSSHVATIERTESDSQSQRSASAPASRAPPIKPPPGLSEHAFKRLRENPFTPDALEKAKLGIVNFLGANIFPEHDIVCHYVIASSDTRHSVATQADMELKRITGSIDWNSREIINKLFHVFQGTVIVKGKEVKADQRRAPACTRIRLKIFPIFLKSTEAANTFPACIQVVFDCLFGTNPNQKLRNMAVQFVHHICFSCDVVKFKMFDAVLLSGMIKLIDEAKEDPKLRSLAYGAVGKIARKSPQRVTKDITLAQQFFNAVCQEDSETRLAVQEALSMMSEAFKQLDDTNKKLMEALIMQSIDKPEPQARLVAVQYAVVVFPPDHIPSRYVLLLATGDLKEDIHSEALKGLHGQSRSGDEHREDKSISLPEFTAMMAYIREQANQRMKSPHRYVSGNKVLPFNPTAYAETMLYLRKCLLHSARVKPDEDGATMKSQAPRISRYVNHLMTQYPDSSGPIQRYVAMLRHLLTSITTPQVMYCLLEVVAVAANNIAPNFVEHTNWIKTFISSSKDDIRDPAAELFAIVIMYCGKDDLIQQALEEFTSNLNSKNVVKQHGSLLGLGYLIGHLIRRRSYDMETDSADQRSVSVLQAHINTAVFTIASMVKTSEQSLLSSVCVALGEICRNGVMPLPNGDSNEEKTPTKLSLVKNLINVIETSKETAKVKERAVVCLGYMCVGDPEFPHRRKIIEDLLNAVQDKQVELHFTIADSLVCAALGCRSPAARSMWTQTEEEFAMTVQGIQDDVDWYLTKLLSTYVCHANPHLRQAACIWLLSLVKQCGSHDTLQQHIKEVQRAFMRLLSENDEITQDVASKGLGVVYEKCTPEQKDSLVSELVDTLMTGKRPQQEVTGETQVFQEGALGKTPEGSSLSTYKELCAIANDLNQPDLIYKFMHLANHNAMWNSRRGAAFGFTTIAAQAGEQLAPYMSQIVPRLYRYQFDPNPKIQQAMSSIWNALVQDNKKTVDKYIQQIMGDLLKNLTSNQWRIRESSCLAVTDLLRGRQIDEIIHLLPELWETCLKVRDDIKESVRNAADLACKALSRVSVKICDPSHGSVGEKATSVMLPCLLNNSLQSSVPEVRAIGLSTLLQISKNAGVLMKPHIPIMVTALLEAVSGLEPQVMNYLSFHVSSQATQEKLDSARIAASKMSPMMETINRCVQYVDDSVLPELVPRLTELIKSGIGVGTKAGCASFVVSLIHQCPQDLSPHAGKLMGAFLHGLADRNLSVRKAYASTLGNLAKIAKDSSLEKLITRLKSYYLEKEDEVFHVACGLTLRAMSQHSSDALRRHAALAMPLAFFAMHEKVNKDDKSSETGDSVWEEVWQEVTPGTEAGLRLYLTEIVDLLYTSLESQLWSTKAQAAAAMSTVASKLGSNLGSPHLGVVLKALLTGLQGRTWEGKESLLQALSTVCTSCKEAITKGQAGQATIEEIVEAVLKECKKEKPAYRIEALKCLSEILETYNIDRFADVWEIVDPIIQKSKSSAKDQDEDMSSATNEAMKDCVYATVGQTWPTTLETQVKFQTGVSLELCTAIPLNTWRVQVTILKAINKFVDRLCGLDSDDNEHGAAVERVIQTIVAAVIPSLGNMKYTVIRSESLAVIEIVLKKLTEANRLETISTSREQLVQELSTLSQDGVWDVREKASKVLSMVDVTS